MFHRIRRHTIGLIAALALCLPAHAADDGNYSRLKEVNVNADDTTGSGVTLMPGIRLFVTGSTARFWEAWTGTSDSPTTQIAALLVDGELQVVKITNATADFTLGDATSDSLPLVVSMTTAQRDAHSASNGNMVYNSTTGNFQIYEAGAWANVASGSLVPLSQGGLGFDASGIAKGDLIVGTGTGTAGIAAASGGSAGDVWTLKSDGTTGLVTPPLASEADPTLTNDGAVAVGSGANDPVTITWNADAGTDGTISWSGASDLFTIGNTLRLGQGTQNYDLIGRSNALTLQGQTAATESELELFASDGDGTDNVYMRIYGIGTPGSVTNTEFLLIGYDSANTIFVLEPNADGTGTVRSLEMRTEGNAQQLILQANGDVVAAAGALQAGIAGVDGQIVIYSEQGATDYTVTVNPNAAMTQNVTYALPPDDGTSGQVLHTDGAGNLTWALDDGAAGGISAVVDDLTPQLGGHLDVNGQVIGDGTRELLAFVEDGSAVNHLQIENEATGSGPILSSVGDDANVDLNLATKGTGDVVLQAQLDVNGQTVLANGATLSATELSYLDGATSNIQAQLNADSENAQDAHGALLADAQSSESGLRQVYDDATDSIDVTVIIDSTRKTFFTTQAVTEGTTVVNLTNPSETIGAVSSCECNEWENVSFTVTPTGGGTDVDVTLWDTDLKTTALVTWEAWDASAGAMVDTGWFTYWDADNTQETHITVDAVTGGPGTYTITVVGRCIAGAWVCP